MEPLVLLYTKQIASKISTERLSSREKAVLEASPDGGAVVLRVPVLYAEVEENKESAVKLLLGAVYKVGSQRVEMDHWSIRYPT